MAAGTPNMPSLKERFTAELLAERKKAAILAALVLVALIVGGRQLFKSTGPSDADAAAGSPSASDAGAPQGPPRTANPLPLGGPAAPAADRQAAAKWRSTRPPDGSVLRDLFVTDLKSYARIEPKSVKKPTTQRGQAVRDMMEIEKAVRTQAKGLLLQSTMIGANSSAVINGRVLRVGEHIAGFRIVAIRPGSCEVEKDRVRVSLRMKK